MILTEIINKYLVYLKQQNYSNRTIENYTTALNHFMYHFDDIELDSISSKDLMRFQRHLYQNSKLNAKSQGIVLTVIRMLFKFAMRIEIIESDPTTFIELPRIAKTLPRNLVSVNQVKAMIQATDYNDPLALRNRCILELFYATGMRVSELINLNIYSINKHKRQIRIIGKGNKERIIPISDRAILLTLKYQDELRPQLLNRNKRPQLDNGFLILSWRGRKMARDTVSTIIKTSAKLSGINYTVTPHSIRHSLATHLLKAGMGIRYIQELLGHEDLRTTQIYTRVENIDLIEMMERFHPLSI